MLAAKGFPSICTLCRSNILASQTRNASRTFHERLAIRSRLLQTGTSIPRSRTQPPQRQFSTSIRRLSTEGHQVKDSQETKDSPTVTPRLSVEESARKARALFGDALPRDYLNEDEFRVYQRLYGTPIFVENVEDLQEVEGEQEIFEEQLPDGTSILLRKGEDGELEEVEIFTDSEEEVILEQEDLENGEEKETRTEAEWEEYKELKAQAYHEDVYEKSRTVREAESEDPYEEEDDDFMRSHPLTIAGRSKPNPSTIYLPYETFVEPVATLLTRANHKHLAESANRLFGGPGLPRSASTPAARLNQEQKPIPLDPSQAEMGNIEADAYLAAVMPANYATTMSTLVEVRRRLGTTWIERLLKKNGGPVVLDAGSGGSGIIAWHEVLKAEWERMHEESGATSYGSVPLGKSTVLTGSYNLRQRASRLLENTTFIPRLPDIVSNEEENNTQQPRKVYDLIIAPHTLWPLKQEYLRKELVEKYWSLLNPKGGVLIILEKGLPRGFEVVAAARQHLLDNHIASPESAELEIPVEKQISSPDEETRFSEKETGMIIAPCTTHSTCPMYQSPGISHGRKDFCYFSQRYIRPPYLQRILDAKDRNHEDVQFSYVAVQRGRDQRLPLHDVIGKGVVQNEETTTRAFEGHEWNDEGEPCTAADVNTLSLPRLVLPALKRRGHITFDVCTPAGKLERWTVPRSFSKQGFRDARKVRWGDLWALGAKTRTPRNVRLGRPRDEFDKKGRRIKAPKKQVYEIDASRGEHAEFVTKRDGRYQQDRKIRGSGGRKGRKKSVNQIDDELD